MVKVTPIRTESDYEAALARIDVLMDAVSAGANGDELDVLVTLVERYEDIHYPIGYPEPVAAIRFYLDQHDLAESDLVPWLGTPESVAELLAGKRDLTMPMARALHERLGIPAEILLRKPAAVA